jgi:hypothetical protein
MRLKTKRVRVDVPVSDDGAFITVQALKDSEIARIVAPCKDLFSISGTESEEEVGRKFTEKLQELEEKQDLEMLGRLVGVFHSLFKALAVGFNLIEDEDGNSLVFSEESVDMIIEHDSGFVCQFVIPALSAISEEEERVSKNCFAGLVGSITQTEPAANNVGDSTFKIADNATVRDRLTMEITEQ